MTTRFDDSALCNNTLDATINKRILDTDYNFNRNVGYVKCRTSVLSTTYMTKIESGQYAGRMERRTYCGMGRVTNDSPLLRQRLILLSDWQSMC